MADTYDPVPDLARLLDAALRGGRDGSAHAERIAERLGLDPDAGPKAAGRLLRTALGLPACECPVGGGGTVLPLACPVHGTPCDVCGGLESCTDDCGETCQATGSSSGTVCGGPSAGLYRAACAHGHVPERRLCARHASAEEGLWCKACFELDGTGSHVCDVTPALVAGTAVRAAAGEGKRQ